MLIGMAGSWWKWQAREGARGVAVMSARAIWIGALVLLLVAGASMWTLFALFGAGSTQDKIHLEIVKLAGGIVVGTGGVAALLLAARRQRATELQLAQNERDLAQKERAADDARHDAAERRITELYSSAAEQLGSDKPPVRLAAMHALERLAQDNPSHRQTIVDLLCAYLRMPLTSPDPQGRPDHLRQEGQVRLSAQRLLTAHLRPAAESKFWTGMDLDLSRSPLASWDMRGCHVRNASFDEAVFTGDASFQQAKFDGTVSFRAAEFYDAASFNGTRFDLEAEFRETRFRGTGFFRTAEFHGASGFDEAEFQDAASFAEGTFSSTASFRRVAFRSTVSFREAEFHDMALFGSAELSDSASFAGARFRGSASFGGARFDGTASFRAAEFRDTVWFDRTQLEDPDFSDARVLAADWAAAQNWLRRLPGWQLTEGEAPDEQQRRWHRFVSNRVD